MSDCISCAALTTDNAASLMAIPCPEAPATGRERIRQIEAKALRKLRHPNHNRRLREYIE